MRRAAAVLAIVFASAGCRDGGDGSSKPAAPPLPAAPAVDARPAVVFLGDSLTAGYGLAGDEALPARIGQRIAAAGLGLRVINAGRSGDTSAGGLARLAWYLRPEVHLAALVVNLGSNDSLRGLALDELEKNLGQIIARTRAAAPAAPIFLVQLETLPNMGAEYADAYRAIFPRVAAATGAIPVPFPLAEIVLTPKLNLGDGVHPNVAGVERIADVVWPALEPTLRSLAH